MKLLENEIADRVVECSVSPILYPKLRLISAGGGIGGDRPGPSNIRHSQLSLLLVNDNMDSEYIVGLSRTNGPQLLPINCTGCREAV